MRTRCFLLALIAFLLPTGAAWAAGSDQDSGPPTGMTALPEAAPRILELVNRERAAAGLPGLALDDEAGRIAVSWSREMAVAGAISHNHDYLSNASLQRLDATKAGENVAYAGAVDEIHSMLMASPPHRANILNPGFLLVGVGAVRTSSGQLFLTEDFLTRRAAPSSPEAPPSPRPTPAPRPARVREPARPRSVRPVAPRSSHPVASAVPAPSPSVPAPVVAADPAPASAPPVVAAEPAPMAAPAPVEEQQAPSVETEPASTPGDATSPPAPSHRRQDRSGDLIKGLPVLALVHRWRGRGRR
jgi:uncharacterized protein YkwD